MATSSRYRVPFRRRREKKTNFRKRIALLKSGLPRLVIRKTGRNIHVQLVESGPSGDKTLFEATASELKKFGYKGSGATTPAAYLTGYLLSKKAQKIKKAVPDFGLAHPTSERLLAAVKGAKDGGLEVGLGKTHLKDERIKGAHIGLKDEVEKLKEKIGKAIK